MLTPICSNEAYEKLKSAQLLERIKQHHKDWKRILLVGPDCDVVQKIFGGISTKSQRTELEEEVKKLSEKLERIDEYEYFPINRRQFLVENPSLLTYVATGDVINKFRDYGFSSSQDLQQAIAALCIGDESMFNPNEFNEYVWRSSSFQHKLSNYNHGDMSFSQIRTDFPEVFEMDYEVNGFGGGQYGWGPFLITVVKYAQAIEKDDIPEIKNWKQLTHGLSNSWSTIDCTDLKELEFTLQQVLSDYILQENHESQKGFPLRINDGNIDFFPYITQDRKLLFLKEDPGGQVSIETNYKFLNKRNLDIRAEFSEEDLPYLMNGIYKLYSRSRQELPAIMDQLIKNKKNKNSRVQ